MAVPSVLDVARAAVRWPVLDIVDRRYRKAPLVDALAPEEGEAVAVAGIASGRGARGERGLLYVGDVAALRREAAVALVEGADVAGQRVYAVGVLRWEPDAAGPFDSYRTAPRIPLLTDQTCLMAPAAWAYFRAGPIRRAAYRLLGGALEGLAGLRDGLRHGAAAAVAVSLVLGLLALVAASLSLCLWMPRASALPRADAAVVRPADARRVAGLARAAPPAGRSGAVRGRAVLP